jgi:carboxyl-terminal processing protease
MPASPLSSRSQNRLLYFSAALIMSSLVLMGQVANTVQKAQDDEFWEFTAMFSEIYKEISEKYVDKVESKKLFEGALQGMFLTLDPHSQYMDPDNYTQLEKDTEGSFSGIGIHIAQRDGVLMVISPIPGSPASRAGVQPRDRIIEIDGKKTDGITLSDAVRKLTGPEGTTVKIGVFREGESQPLQFELVRKSIKIESVTPRILDNNIGYVRIARFSDNTSRDVRRAIEDFNTSGPVKGLIVDLRFNTGGLLTEAVELSSLFLPVGKLVVSTKARVPGQSSELKSEREPVTNLPLIVLVNKSSASASEIFAGAMKDHNRGVLVGIKGQNTFGKGSVQTIEELRHSFEKDESGNYKPTAIRLTTARYYLPSGVSIDKEGVTPDIALELPKDFERTLVVNGLIGDPPSTEEDDSQTTRLVVSWKNGKLVNEVKDTTGTEDRATGEIIHDPNDHSTTATTASGDAESTSPKPRRIIPLLKEIAGADAEPETNVVRRPELPKRKAGQTFVDYQLEVAKRILLDHVATGKPMTAPGVGGFNLPVETASSTPDSKTK